LSPATEYQLHVTAGSTDLRTELAAFAGARFVGEAVFTFTTEAAPPPGEPTGTSGDPVAASPCDAMLLLVGACTGSQCHGGGAPGTSPAMGMDLSSPAGIAATVIASPAALTDPSTEGVGGLVIGAFPTGLRRVRVGSSSESFLMYKMLAHTVTGLVPPPSSVLDVPGLDDATNARTAYELSQVIPGSPEPNPTLPREPNNPATASPLGLTWDQLRTIRRWIDQGAGVPTDCPAP
ncbi:MAG: hypothetical protein ACHREM_32575, partial [Polyangiales bacterium]